VFSAAFIFDQAVDTTNHEGAPPLFAYFAKGRELAACQSPQGSA